MGCAGLAQEEEAQVRCWEAPALFLLFFKQKNREKKYMGVMARCGTEIRISLDSWIYALFDKSDLAIFRDRKIIQV